MSEKGLPFQTLFVEKDGKYYGLASEKNCTYVVTKIGSYEIDNLWTVKLPEKNEDSIPHFKLTIEDRFDDPIIEIDGEVVDLTDVHYMVFDQRMMLVKNPYATKWISEKIKMSMGIVTNENQRNGIFGKIYYMAKNILPWNLDCYREQRQTVDDAIKESKEKYLEEKNKK